MSYEIDALRREIEKRGFQRIQHILGCEESAAKLAKQWGVCEAKARFAALLHDITKEYSHMEQLNFVKKYGIIVDSGFDAFPMIAHAVTGAAVAAQEYGADEEIQSAIRWHATGRRGMTALEKILYLADYIEPTRNFSGLEKTRALALVDLDAAVLQAAGSCLQYNISKQKPIHPATLELYNEFVELGKYVPLEG